MSPAFLQPLALSWPKLARAALLVLPLVAHAAQACSPLQHGHPINKDKRSPAGLSGIEEMVSNFLYPARTETLSEVLAQPAELVSTQPHGELQHVGAVPASRGAPVQFQQAGQTGSKYPARFGLDYSGNYFPQSSSAAAAHGVDHSSAVEHGGGVQLPAHPAVLVSTRPHGELQYVRALTATSGAPVQFQQAGQTGSKYPARFGLDYSGNYFPQSSSAAAAHGGAHSSAVEHGGGVQLPAHPAVLVSTRPHGELQYVRALTATSGAPAQFQLAGRKRSQDTARLGVDDSGYYLPRSSSTAAANGVSYPQENGGGVHPAQMGVPTEPASFSRDNTYFAPQRMVHVAQSSHQGFPAPPTAINHAGSSSLDMGARSAPRPDDAPELTEAAHGSRPSRLPDTMSEVKLFPARLEQIEWQYEQLSGSNAFHLGMSKAVHFDIDGARLSAARKAGLEADARNLLAQGIELMELRRLLERSIRYRTDMSKWYVVADEELRTWLERVYTLRGRISGVLKDGDYTYSIKAHVGVEWDTSVIERLLRTQQESHRRQGHSFNKQHLVGPFEMSGDVEEPFVFASYFFRLMRSSSNLPETGQIAVLPFEPFFNYDPIVLKLPIVTPGILKRANLPTAIEHAGSSSSLRRARTVPRPEDATEPTEAAHGSASSHLPGNTRKVKLAKASEDQIELAFKKLLASPTILEGLTNGVIFDIDEVRLDAARKAGVEVDARKLLAEGIHLMELRSLLERSIRYGTDTSKWYVATDEELRAWLESVYTLRERISSSPHDVKYTYSIEALEGVERNGRALGSLRRLQSNMHQRHFKEQQSLDILLPNLVGPFEKSGAVEKPFVFASYVFQVVHQSKALAGQRQIAVLPYEPFFNYDPIVLKLPVVAPGILKVEKPPARLDQSEVS